MFWKAVKLPSQSREGKKQFSAKGVKGRKRDPQGLASWH